MKESFKRKIVLLIWQLSFTIVVATLIYYTFGNPKPTGMLTPGVQIVKTENDKQIEIYKQYVTPYALKIQDNNKFYLKYYGYESNKPVENKFEITSQQYNKLPEGKEYWLKVQFKNKMIIQGVLLRKFLQKTLQNSNITMMKLT